MTYIFQLFMWNVYDMQSIFQVGVTKMKKDDQPFSNNQYIDDDIMTDIKASLARQICAELDVSSDNSENSMDELVSSLEYKKRVPKVFKISGIILSAILAISLVVVLLVNGLLGKINITDWANTQKQDETFEEGDGLGEQIDPDSVTWGENGSLRQEKSVVNILLVGEESINDGGSRGRTDCIMIATMNVKQKSLKLTSIMRDMYVQIPGYSDNKINAAYHNGGIPLLKETIQLNFDIELDGAVLVNFDGFEEIINKLGGVEITLSESEASYLNSTNYISNPANRNVSAGTQILSGNQALGYSRVRYRKASNGEADDFGRTSRQRTVLNAVFDKYKSKNLAELVLLLNDILPLVTTDIQKSDIIACIGTFVTMGTTELETLRLPIDNGYSSATIRGMDVLLSNMPANIETLHNFIFGSTETSTSTNTTNTTDATNTNDISY